MLGGLIIECTKPGSFEEYKTLYGNAVYFVDEADFLIKRRLVIIQQYACKCIGLVALRDSNVYFFSATLSRYLEDLLRQCIKNIQIHKMPAMRSIIEDVEEICEYTGKCFTD